MSLPVASLTSRGLVVHGDAPPELVGASNPLLQQKMKPRHLQMIAVGGSIGTGLFVSLSIPVVHAERRCQDQHVESGDKEASQSDYTAPTIGLAECVESALMYRLLLVALFVSVDPLVS